MSNEDETRKGTLYGFLAYLAWGMFPLYFHALIPAGPWEILAHRILWTLLLCVVLLGVTRHLGFLRSLFGDLKRLGAISIAAVLIAINWVVYVLAVTTGHVTEASLGYFLNPLVTVMLGVLVLGEKLRRMQWLAVAIGVIACVYLAVDYGSPPWISVGLALSFAAYGLMKKRVGGRLTALEGLTAETVVLAPFAAVMLVWLGATGRSTWSGNGSWHPVLLALSGVATAIPLLLFAAAARRIPLSTIGLLQFMTPVIQLLCGVLVLGETMSAGRWVGFGLVWIALVVLTADSLAQARRTRRARRATALETSAAAPT
ncbi:EamA family transporter RarD [Dermacoccus abyssi]|uniref:EamA family transporter RarD n=1 Tax=Dermacoccus abyssi TaxID=322596 RepID=UPI0030B80AF7